MTNRSRTNNISFPLGNAERAAFLGLAGCISLAFISVVVSQIFLALALIASILMRSANKKILSNMKWTILPLVLFCCWTVVSALAAPDVAHSLTITKKFYLFLILPLTPLIVRSPNRALWLYKAVITVAFVSSCVGIVQFLSLTEAERNDLLNRISGFMGHWMTYSGLLMLSLVLLVSYGLHIQWKKSPRWFSAAVILALAIVMTKTRSAALGVYAGILVMLVLAMLLEKHKRFLVYLIGLILVSSAIYFASPLSLQQRFRNGLDPKDPNTRNRITLYETSSRIIRDHPWLGVGPKNVRDAAQEYRREHEFPDWLYQHMHNNILQVATETGLPGLAFWLWFMIRLAWDALRVYRHALSKAFSYGEENRFEAILAASAALGCWIALMVAGMFEYNFGDSEVLTLFLFIASVPCAYLPDREAQRQDLNHSFR